MSFFFLRKTKTKIEIEDEAKRNINTTTRKSILSLRNLIYSIVANTFFEWSILYTQKPLP